MAPSKTHTQPARALQVHQCLYPVADGATGKERLYLKKLSYGGFRAHIIGHLANTGKSWDKSMYISYGRVVVEQELGDSFQERLLVAVAQSFGNMSRLSDRSPSAQASTPVWRSAPATSAPAPTPTPALTPAPASETPAPTPAPETPAPAAPEIPAPETTLAMPKKRARWAAHLNPPARCSLRRRALQ